MPVVLLLTKSHTVIIRFIL